MAHQDIGSTSFGGDSPSDAEGRPPATAEDQYRSLFEHAPIGIYRMTPDRQVLMANAALLDMLDYGSLEEMRADLFSDTEFGPSYTWEEFSRWLDEDGVLRGIESEWVLRDGSRRYFRESARVHRDANGEILYFEGSLEDLTAGHEAAEALRFTRHLLKRVGNLILVANADAEFVYVSPSVEAILGYKPEEVLGDGWWRLTWSGDSEGMRKEKELIRRMTAGEISVDPRLSPERLVFHKNGEPRWLVWQHSPMAGQIVGIAHDITERRKAAQRLEETNRTLTALIDSSPSGIFTLDAEGRVTLWNQAAEGMFGWSSEEVLGGLPPVTAPSGSGDVTLAFADLLRGKRLEEPECQALRRNGDTIHVSISGAPLVDEQGEVSGAVVVAADVTEQRSLEEELQLTRRLEAVGRLAGGVAHDFNNLLTGLLGFADLAEANLHDEEAVRESLDEIRSAAQRAAALTAQLLAFGRQRPAAPEDVNLNTVTADTERLLRRTIGEDVALSTDLEPALAFVHADPGHLVQILMNLALNARDAMPDGGDLLIATRNVELAVSDSEAWPELGPGPYVDLSVVDSGPGIPEDVRERVFEPFFTTKTPGEGSGLGLATVHGLVAQIGGAIRVESGPGRGARFRVLLPSVPGPKGREPTEVEVTVGTPAGAGGTPVKPGTVFVIEDEDQVRSVVARALRRCGYDVHSAAHPSEAVELFELVGADVDLVLCDVVMPELSGPELVERLRRIRPDFKLSFMTGYAESELDMRVRSLVGVEVLSKPFTVTELIAWVKRVMDDHP